MMDDLFPKIKKSVETLIEDEEGNIPGKKLLLLGTMVLVLGNLLSIDALAGHTSHRSHVSHSSHSSGSGGYHESHVSHQSHQSHVSGSGHSSHSSYHSSHASHSNHNNHASHTSHSNTVAHSNSKYTVEGDVQYAPAASSIPSVSVEPKANMIEALNIETNASIPANSTPATMMAPNLPTSLASVAGAKYEELDIPKTEPIE